MTSSGTAQTYAEFKVIKLEERIILMLVQKK
jgi:hypothetical protein